MSWYNSNWEVMPSVFEPSFAGLSLLYQRFDLAYITKNQLLRKDYLLKLYQDLAQGFSQIFQTHLETDSVSNIKQQNYKIYL